MSKMEENLKRLEKKIDEQHVEMKKFIEEVVKLGSITNLKWRERAESIGQRREKIRYFRGLIVGLLLGIVGNLFASCWMEFLRGVAGGNEPLWVWAVSTSGYWVGILCFIWWLDRESKR